MKTIIKIKVHSVIDLITNSSTEIFTYSNKSEEAFKNAMAEFLQSLNVKESFDDMFLCVLLNDDYEVYCENYNDYVDNPSLTHQQIQELYENVKLGKTQKPDWFKEIEDAETNYENFNVETYLYIIPKDKKYEKTAKLMRDFLYSTRHEASYCG